MKSFAFLLMITGAVLTLFTIFVVATETTTLPGLNDKNGTPIQFHLQPSVLLLSVAMTCAGGYMFTTRK